MIQHLTNKRMIEAALMIGIVFGSIFGFAAKTTLDHVSAATFDQRFGKWDHRAPQCGGGWFPGSYEYLVGKKCLLPSPKVEAHG